MNILFYMTRFPGFGGIETVTEIIGKGLVDKGHNISIITHLAQDKPSDLLNKANYYILPDSTKWNSQRNYTAIMNVIHHDEVDAIVYQDSYAPSYKTVCKISEATQIPLFVFEHNSPVYMIRSHQQNQHKGNFVQRCVRSFLLFPLEEMQMRKRKLRLLQTCHKYILLSDKFITDFDEVIGKKDYSGREKITAIHNPLDMPIPTNLNKQKYVLYVGRLEEVKRVDVMLRIWKTVELRTKEWRFVIVGDGAQRSNLETLSKELKLSRVSFEGFKDNPLDYYKDASIFWLTSAYEGWTMTLVEAMCNGCVPIAFDTYSSLHDIIQNDDNGFIIKNNSDKAFLEATLRLMNSPTTLHTMNVNAQKYIRRYDKENVLHDWEQILKS